MKGSFSVGKDWALRRGRRGATPQTPFPARNKDKQTARKIIKSVPGATKAAVPALNLQSIILHLRGVLWGLSVNKTIFFAVLFGIRGLDMGPPGSGPA